MAIARPGLVQGAALSSLAAMLSWTFAGRSPGKLSCRRAIVSNLLEGGEVQEVAGHRVCLAAAVEGGKGTRPASASSPSAAAQIALKPQACSCSQPYPITTTMPRPQDWAVSKQVVLPTAIPALLLAVLLLLQWRSTACSFQESSPGSGFFLCHQRLLGWDVQSVLARITTRQGWFWGRRQVSWGHLRHPWTAAAAAAFSPTCAAAAWPRRAALNPLLSRCPP